jgi:hypothetical protein
MKNHWLFERALTKPTILTMNVELTSLMLTPEEKENISLVGQQTPQALQEGTLSAAFVHLASLDQILGAFKTAAGPFNSTSEATTQ